MNHDATHCLDYNSKCPINCYRAQLTKELIESMYFLSVSFVHLKDTDECLKKGKENE